MDPDATDQTRSFEDLYVAWCPVVRRVAMALLGDADAADDVAHEVFQRLLNNSRWRGIDAPARYFWSAGLREALCVRRARRLLEPMSQSELVKLPFQGPGPEELAALEERARNLRAHVAQLPMRCAEAMTLVGLYGLSHAEAAAQLGVTVKAVEKQVARGREHLRRSLSHEDDPRRVSGFEDGGA